ncbi:winged helix-turn-helix domain-containing protein [Amycolatopsis sp.]|uniref:winged helix-turn-helix domain-containing protein n=1 Tax=Amycolatopsis sp. TaxID=37632 RepID=UPI002BB63ADA|nr:winged helix-turn-helix domain-containing protein [Amycolatopsis sp.]HVV08114.1 winged helix-turn-helix domain-containing protein [Amycolatopsis sp.]
MITHSAPLSTSDIPAARGLGGIGTPAELLRTVTLDGVVLLVSPGPSPFATGLKTLCENEKWPVVEASTCDGASWAASARKTSLIVVTGGDPAFVLAAVKAVRRVTSSVLAVVAALNSRDRMRALGAGADLALPAGLDPGELRFHLVALVRRASDTWEPQVRYLQSGALVVDLWARECALGDRPVHLSPTEYQLLLFLMRHPRQALPTSKIIQRVWRSRAYQGQVNAARIAVSRLRAKLGHGADGAPIIRSVRGVGYEFPGPVLEFGDGGAGSPGTDLGNLKLSAVVLRVADVLATRPFPEAAQFCVDAVVAATGGDAGAIFRKTSRNIVLCAENGHPEEFRAFMSRGVPVRSRYVVHALEEAQPTQIDDITRLARMSEAVKIMAAHGFSSYFYVPLLAGGRTWGGLRLASRGRRPLDPAMTTFCSAVGAMLSLKLPDPDEISFPAAAAG